MLDPLGNIKNFWCPGLIPDLLNSCFCWRIQAPVFFQAPRWVQCLAKWWTYSLHVSQSFPSVLKSSAQCCDLLNNNVPYLQCLPFLCLTSPFVSWNILALPPNTLLFKKFFDLFIFILPALGLHCGMQAVVGIHWLFLLRSMGSRAHGLSSPMG